MLSRIAIHRPVTTMMFFAGLLVAGIMAFQRIPLAWLPNLDFPVLWIWAPYPNSSPTYVEKMITRPIEEQLATLGGYENLHSSSEADGANFRVEFPWGVPMEVIRLRVKERLDRVKPELPEGMEPIRVFSFSSESIPVVEARISAEGLDLSKNYTLIDYYIVKPIARIPGVAKVDVGGVLPAYVEVALHLKDIQRYRIFLPTLLENLRSLNASYPLGQVFFQDTHLLSARAVGTLPSLTAFENWPILRGKLKLKDIADITFHHPRRESFRHVNGKRAVNIEVFKESTANTVTVARAVKQTIEEEINQNPHLKGIHVFTWNDQAEDIVQGLQGLLKAGLWGGLLAAFILLFFLRHPIPTLVVFLSIPFSILLAGLGLFLLGKSLNILTMMGLMLAVGMLVDNCIVVLEAIVRYIWQGERHDQAALKGSKEVGVAITAATLTTVIVFLPLIIGGKGEIFIWLKEVGETVSIAILSSLLMALLLIPFLFGQMKKLHWENPKDNLKKIKQLYQRMLAWSLEHRWKTGGLAILAFILSFLPLLTGWVKVESLQGGIKNTRMGFRYRMQDTFSLSEVENFVHQMEAFLFKQKAKWGIENIYSHGSQERAMTVITFHRDVPEEEARKIRQFIRKHHPPIPGVEIAFWNQDEREGGRFLRLHVFADSMDRIQQKLPEILRRLEALPGVEDAHSDIVGGQEEIIATLNRREAQNIGLTPLQVARLFTFTLGSQRLHRFPTPKGEVDVRLSLREEDRKNVEDLQQLLIQTWGGKPVTLAQVAKFRYAPRPGSIERENRRVGIGISLLYEGKDFKKGRRFISQTLDQLMSPGMSWSFSRHFRMRMGEAEEMKTTFLLALVLIYVVMASLFESFSHPFAIMLSLPFALFGVTWFFTATGSPLNLMAQIGLLMLIGIVVNNGIVLLDRVRQLRQSGLDRKAALVEGGSQRLRPILMTATTTIVGLLPLAFGKASIGNAYYYPLARTVVGGLLTSTFLTLLLLPYLYSLVDDAGRFISKKRKENKHEMP